jgi:hypothetical protein
MFAVVRHRSPKLGRSVPHSYLFQVIQTMELTGIVSAHHRCHRAEAGTDGDHRLRPLNSTMSFVVVAREMPRRWPSGDHAKSMIVRSVKWVS